MNACPTEDVTLSPVEPQESRLGIGERRLMLALFALSGVLRLFYLFRDPIDSDEPQHLHVAWAWGKGLVQYRDIFDNHAPLFHLLFAPLVSLVGERPNILIAMRFMMIPLYGVTIWTVFALGRSLLGRRAGAWAALLLAFYPNFFFCSLEFRTDNLWVMLWLLSLFALLGGRLDLRRGFIGGLLLGTAFCVSFKTIAMVAALAGAGLILPLVTPGFFRGADWKRRIRGCGAFVCGFGIPPAAMMLAFWLLGAWKDFIYCTIQHNMIPARHHAAIAPIRLIFLFYPLMLALCARRFAVRSALPGARRIAALLLITGLFYAILQLFWPIIQNQTMLSFYPLLLLTSVAVPFAFVKCGMRNAECGINSSLIESRRRCGKLSGPLWWLIRTLHSALRNFRGSSVQTLGYAVLFFLAILIPTRLEQFNPAYDKSRTFGGFLEMADPRDCVAPPQMRDFLGDVLKLTNPTDFVLDTKGEAIFRRRPYYYVLERFTATRILKGLLPNNISARCIATRTCVTVNNRHRFPVQTRHFLSRSYINVGHLSVAGQMLKPINTAKTPDFTFNIAIPASYEIVGEHGKVDGRLDGKICEGAVFLAPGRHDFIPKKGERRLASVWSQAVDRGFSPFNLARP